MHPETIEYITGYGKMWELLPGVCFIETDMHTIEELEVFINKLEDIEKRHIVAEFESFRDEDGSMLFCNITVKGNIL